MILEIPCRACGQTVLVQLPDETSEAMAAQVAEKVFCVRCAAAASPVVNGKHNRFTDDADANR